MARAAAVKILATKTATLKVPLTEAELKEVAEQTYRVEGDLRAFYNHKKEVTADLKSKEEQLDAALARLGRLGRDKCEYRPVAVRVEADFRMGKVFEIREDTGEVVAERAVNEQDRQADLFKGEPRAASEKKPEPPPLEWKRQGLNAVAETPGGTYCVEPNTIGGGCDVHWTPIGGRSKAIGASDTEEQGKEKARAHYIETAADALLANAGDGKLNAKDVKGPAEKFKKGGRRA